MPPLPERPPSPEGAAGQGGGSVAGAGGAGQPVEIVTYPATQAGRAPRVAQFELRPQPGRGLDAASVVLARGEVSDVALRGLAKGEPPKSLLERVVPSLIVPLEGGGLVVAPSAPLDAGAYTLAAGSALFRQGIEVVDDGLPIVKRLWPPASGGAANFGVYCAEEALPADLKAEPGPMPGAFELQPGVIDDARVETCVTLMLGEAGGAAEGGAAGVAGKGSVGSLAPPPRLLAGGVPFALLDPAPLTRGPGGGGGPSSALCAPPSVALGPLCCEALDDRLVLRPGPTPVLALVEAGSSIVAHAFVDGPAVLRGLVPESRGRVSVRAYDAAGGASEASIEVTTGAARPHVVINEVLADALGPEPASEWVELVNDGDDAIELEGYRLADGGGEVALPAHRLGPGELVLLTAEGFVPGAGGDVAPAPAAKVLTLPSLGKSGLSNAGEALSLLTPGGAIVSRFPALPKPKSGASVARRRPDVPDDDAGGFVLSAPGGPTPGAPNVVP